MARSARKREMGDAKGSLADLALALRANPKNPVALNARAWELLTCKQEELRDPTAALPLARKAAELTGSKNSAILDTLALALFRNGRAREALATQEKAIKLLPPKVPPADRKEYEERLLRYRRAVSRLPAEAGGGRKQP